MEITDDRTIDDVRAELASDPRVPYADEIAVEDFGYTVTLRGSLGASPSSALRPPTIAGRTASSTSTTSCRSAPSARTGARTPRSAPHTRHSRRSP